MSYELAEMFLQSTGTHFLDSGGAYGRHWQRNKEEAKKFDGDPVKFCEAQQIVVDDFCAVNQYITLTVPTYYILEKYLSYCEEKTEQAHKWVKAHLDEDYVQCADLVEWLRNDAPILTTEDDDLTRECSDCCGSGYVDVEEDCEECGGDGYIPGDEDDDMECGSCNGFGTITTEEECSVCEGYGEITIIGEWESPGEVFTIWGDSTTPTHGNTYNSENMFSQDFIFLQWQQNGTRYTAIQIHGGCDARGGYTEARIFEHSDYDEGYEIFPSRFDVGYEDCYGFQNHSCEIGYGGWQNNNMGQSFDHFEWFEVEDWEDLAKVMEQHREARENDERPDYVVGYRDAEYNWHVCVIDDEGNVCPVGFDVF